MNSRKTENCLLIVFDFDGVLADSKDAFALQMQDTIKFFTNKLIPEEIFKERVGNTDQGQDFVEFLGSNDPQLIDKAIIQYVSLTEKYAYLRKLYPNVRETLETLKKDHIIGIVSRKSQERMEKWLHHFKITHLFDRPIGTLENSKSNAILQIMKEFNIPPERTIMVGDTEFDVLGAKDAGVHSVIALYGAANPEEVFALSPTYSINSIEEIIKIVEQHLDK